MAPKILLLGANGQVGWELRRSLLTVGQITAYSRAQCDLADPDGLVKTVREVRPDVIVNAAGYTAVDKAEGEPELAMRINAEAPGLLADEVKKLGGLYVDYSTDYVFDGTKAGAYIETDAPNPLNVYGLSKLEGLRAIERSGCRHLVFRVSWVYGTHGANFVTTILRLAKEREELNVVGDQIGAPTPATLIADVTAHAILMLQSGKGDEGIFHLTPASETSWHGLAREVVAQASAAGIDLLLSTDNIRPITTAEYPTGARRPTNSRLDTSKLSSTFGLHLPSWQEPLEKIIKEIAS